MRLLLVAVFLAGALADYYQDLGLTTGEESTESDIKRQFRHLSKKLHPDLNPSPEAREQFQRVQKAYGILSDRKKRKVYDMMGEDGLKELEDAEKNPHHGQDMLSMLFGGGGQQQQRNRGNDVKHRIRVSLADIYNGNAHEVVVQKQKLRSKDVVRKCMKCKARPPEVRKVQVAPGFYMQQQVAPDCSRDCGSGGNKVVRVDRTLEVQIEQGIPEGHTIVFEMEGDEQPDKLPGDIQFQVETHPHPLFRRQGDDLLMTVHITLLEALAGFTKSFEHLDGRVVEYSREEVTPPLYRMTMRGEGMPKHNVPSEKGNLYITFEVKFPKALTPQQAAAFRQALA